MRVTFVTTGGATTVGTTISLLALAALAGLALLAAATAARARLSGAPRCTCERRTARARTLTVRVFEAAAPPLLARNVTSTRTRSVRLRRSVRLPAVVGFRTSVTVPARLAFAEPRA